MIVTLLPYADRVANDLYSKLEVAVYKDLLTGSRPAHGPEM